VLIDYSLTNYSDVLSRKILTNNKKLTMNIGSLLGAIIFLFGLILFFGNVSGCMATFPFAGFIVMTMGSLIAKLSRDD
jgi:hypothetical protein